MTGFLEIDGAADLNGADGEGLIVGSLVGSLVVGG